MKKLWKILWSLVNALAVIIPCLIVGWLVGAWLGGNYAENFRFNGVSGYEATGQVGCVVGVVLGISIIMKRKKQ